MTVYLIPNMCKPSVCEAAAQTVRRLCGFGARVLVQPHLAQALVHAGALPCDEQQALEQCDVIAVLGGDGTILRAAHAAMVHNKPIFGVNFGRMGFLSSAEHNEQEKLCKLVRGEWQRDCRHTLCVEADERFHALNDVVISKKEVGQTIELEIFCDGIAVQAYMGDGVVVATATGSTGYSLSAGGPILDTNVQAMVVTPICVHGVHSPSMVFSAQRTISVCAKVPMGGQAALCCDGVQTQLLRSGQRVEIMRGRHQVTLVSFCSAPQLEAMKKKLKGRLSNP